MYIKTVSFLISIGARGGGVGCKPAAPSWVRAWRELYVYTA
jgi:hypothetical protein